MRVGLEQLEAQRGGILRGKRVGLIANAASVTWTGRPALTVLRSSGIQVVRLFAPEHGFGGTLGAGSSVDGGLDRKSGLQIVSLYGDHTKPSAADLRGLDALVYDLQDVGVRFYTYISTMILAEEAAADAGIPFVVLDRPDPLGGDRIEGPVATLPRSFVNTAPGPLVYGLTAGEMARFVNASRPTPGRVSVIPMAGWKRSMTWSDVGRAWLPPSPNLRSPDAALLYAGTGLLEATNVSEGRGTRDPFRIIGAPWFNAKQVLHSWEAPGISAKLVSFTPLPVPAAPAPKYVGIRCQGVELTMADRNAPTFRAGLSLLSTLRTDRGFRWLDAGAAFDRLVGTADLRAALDDGLPLRTIISREAHAVTAWRARRLKSLLY